MADEYVYFLFNKEGELIRTGLRRPPIQTGWKCVGVFADRLIIASQDSQ